MRIRPTRWNNKEQTVPCRRGSSICILVEIVGIAQLNKHINIIYTAEWPRPRGRDSVGLLCSVFSIVELTHLTKLWNVQRMEHPIVHIFLFKHSLFLLRILSFAAFWR